MTPLAVARLLGAWQGDGPAYHDLASRLSHTILDGRLGVDVQLPAERRLAAAMGVSRTTVSGAFTVLREQGFLATRRGSGSVTRLPTRAVDRLTPWMPSVVPDQEPGVLDLTVASTAAPAQLGALYVRALAGFQRDLAESGYGSYGLPELRDAIARRYAERGLPTVREHVLVTSGAQQAIDLVVRRFVRARDTVLVESPTYPGALDSLRAAGARIVGVDVGEVGWSTAAFVDAARRSGASAAYLIPEHQNPTGRLMADAQRAELARALRRLGVTVIVDETLADLALSPAAAPARPFAAYDRGGHVISVGSLSKSVWAGLRVGWLRAAPALVTSLATTTRAAADLGTAPFEQRVATLALAQLEALLAERLVTLRDQRDRFLQALESALAWTPSPPEGGLSAWVRLPRPRSAELAQVAPHYGLLLIAGPRLSPDGALDSFVRLPFALPPALLDVAVQRLVRAWARVA